MTNDVDRRVLEHNSEGNRGSYTANKRPVELLWSTQLTDFNQAEELEKQIKGWSRKKKEAIITGEWDALKVLAACNNASSHRNLSPEPGPFRHTERSRSMTTTWPSMTTFYTNLPITRIWIYFKTDFG